MTVTETARPSLTGEYDIDPAHSRIGFAAKHAMVATVRGTFGEFTADLHLDEDHVANSRARIEINAASVSTGSADRDAHLRSADFFDVEHYPTIAFLSTGAERSADDEYVLTGDLTIKGVSKPVTVTFEKTGAAIDPWGGSRVGFEGRAKVNRKDWNLTWNVALEAGGILVSDKVALEFDISAVRRSR